MVGHLHFSNELLCTCCIFFFFQAEDGIRDLTVTGVQTCALPISIEADPAELRATFAIDVLPESVIIAPDIGFYRERKLRLLNGAHTATAPLALLEIGRASCRERV